ncbi:MAG: ion channel [Pseudobdellovibrio sp.]
MQTSEERFRNIKKLGTQSKWTQDLYHSMLIFSWRKFFLIYVCLFTLFNIFFAFFYWIFPATLAGTDNSFWHAFVFSVQTFSTVGFGVFSPNSDWAHSVVIIESLLSVFVTALLTGLIFAKFSKPSARIIFSNNILINTFEGKRTLMLRMGNLRANQIAEAQVRMVVLKSTITAEGQHLRRQVDLNLVRSSSLFFALTWSVMHIIDESSPLFGMTHQELIDQDVEVGISVIGYDSTFSQSIHANCIYSPNDMIFDKYFEDVFTSVNGKVVSLNYAHFHGTKP